MKPKHGGICRNHLSLHVPLMVLMLLSSGQSLKKAYMNIRTVTEVKNAELARYHQDKEVILHDCKEEMGWDIFFSNRTICCKKTNWQ
nr:hypothetical protein [Escherichia coli]